MLVKSRPLKSKVEHHTCPFHQRHPGVPHAGCTCRSSYTGIEDCNPAKSHRTKLGRKCKQHLHHFYTKIYMDALIKKAKRDIPGFKDIAHLTPRAYCLAKIAPLCAVICVPPVDRETQVAWDNPFIFIRNKSVQALNTGDWCAVAYVSCEISTGHHGENFVLEIYHSPEYPDPERA